MILLTACFTLAGFLGGVGGGVQILDLRPWLLNSIFANKIHRVAKKCSRIRGSGWANKTTETGLFARRMFETQLVFCLQTQSSQFRSDYIIPKSHLKSKHQGHYLHQLEAPTASKLLLASKKPPHRPSSQAPYSPFVEGPSPETRHIIRPICPQCTIRLYFSSLGNRDF